MNARDIALARVPWLTGQAGNDLQYSQPAYGTSFLTAGVRGTEKIN